MTIPPLFRFLRAWLFVIVMLSIGVAGTLLICVMALVGWPRETKNEPLSLQDIDL